MKKLLLVLIAAFLICSPSFAQSGFQPYTKPLSNKTIGNTVLEFEDNNIKITRNKYKPTFGMIEDEKTAIYEYFITNKSEDPIILKNMIAPDRIIQTETSYYTFYHTPNDLLINAASAAYLAGKVIALDKFFQPLPSDYLINAKDTTRVLLLSKTYINPLVEFQFVINGNLQTIKSSAAYIVKDNKYYQSLIDSQNAKYKNIDVFDCIKNNDDYLVEAYLKTGMNPNDSLFGVSLLQSALKAGNPRTVEVLLQSGANPNQQYMGKYLLTQAIMQKQPKIAKMLIDAGANPNQKSLGTYPLIQAIMNKQPEIAEMLINKGANPNQKYRGISTLIWAVKFKQQDVVNELLIKGANPNIKYWGKTALTYAINEKQSKIVEYLINAGAKIDKKSVKYAEKSKDEYIKDLVLSK